MARPWGPISLAYLDALYVVLGSAVLLLPIMLLFPVLNLPDSESLVHPIIAVAVSQIAIAAVVVYRLVQRQSGRETGIPLWNSGWVRAAGWGIGLGVLLFAINVALWWSVSQVSEDDVAPPVWINFSTETLNTMLVAFLLAGVIAPVFEELFFRGILFGRLMAAGSPGVAYVLSATLFALLHAQPEAMIMLAIMGAILAWGYQHTGSILTAILAHSINNCLAMSLLFLS